MNYLCRPFTFRAAPASISHTRTACRLPDKTVLAGTISLLCSLAIAVAEPASIGAVFIAAPRGEIGRPTPRVCRINSRPLVENPVARVIIEPLTGRVKLIFCHSCVDRKPTSHFSRLRSICFLNNLTIKKAQNSPSTPITTSVPTNSKLSSSMPINRLVLG